MPTRSRAGSARTCAPMWTTPWCRGAWRRSTARRPVSFDAQAAAWPSFDAAEVSRAFGELGFTQLTRRVLAYASDGGEAPGASGDQRPLLPEGVIEGAAAWDRLRAAVREGAWLGVFVDDAESAGTLFDLERTVYVALGSGWEVELSSGGCHLTAQGAPATPAGHASRREAEVLRFAGDDAVEALREAYVLGRVATFSAKDDLHLLVPTDSSQPALIDVEDIDTSRVFDISVAAYLLDSNRSDFGRDVLVGAYLPFELPVAQAQDKPAKRGPKAPAVVDEGRREHAAIATARRGACPARRARRHDVRRRLALVLDEIEMPLVPTLVMLERAGMTVSLQRLAELSAELGEQIEQIRSRVFELAGEEFNLDSPMQLSRVLFDTLGLPTKGLKKTQRGYYSTNAKVLEDLSQDYPVVADVLKYREKAKIKSTYLDALPAQVEGDGRVHTQYNQTVTATGRLSSSNPNLQNIPVRSEAGPHGARRLRSAGPADLLHPGVRPLADRAAPAGPPLRGSRPHRGVHGRGGLPQRDGVHVCSARAPRR